MQKGKFFNTFLILLGLFLSTSLSLLGQDTKYDIKISITDTIERFNLKPTRTEPIEINSSLIFREYYLTYNKLDKNITLKSIDSSNLFRTPNEYKDNSQGKSEEAFVSIGFLNFRKSFITDRILLSNIKRYPGSYTSMVDLISEYVDTTLINEQNVILFVVPNPNKKDIDTLFPGINPNCSMLFILWILDSHNQGLPEILHDLDFETLILKSDKSSAKTNPNPNKQENKNTKANGTAAGAVTMNNKPDSVKKNEGPNSDEKTRNFNFSFYVKGPREFDLNNMPVPENLSLSFPDSCFKNEGKYKYYPSEDPYNPNRQFSSMWTLIRPEDFILYLFESNKQGTNKVGVDRAHYEKEYVIRINGGIPEKETLTYNINYSLYKPNLIKKPVEIKGNGNDPQFEKAFFIVPIKTLPNEKISFNFQKPFNYNISLKGIKSDWKNPAIEVPIIKDTTVLELDKIPPFEFFYIDLSGFENLESVKNVLKNKIEKEGNDYFIYVSNSTQPLIWRTGDDLYELLTRISLMRPEPAFYDDEKKYVKPWIDELKYNEERREVHFNFLVSQSFLNYSSLDFIQDCMGDLIDEDKIDEGKITINSYSTADNVSYIEENKYNKKDKKNSYYKKIIKEKGSYTKL